MLVAVLCALASCAVLFVQELEQIANSAPSGGGKGHSRYASGGGFGGGGYGGAGGMGGGFGMGSFGGAGGMKRGLSPPSYGDDRSTRPRY